MNGDAAQVAHWAQAVQALLSDKPAVRGVFCPPFPYLSVAAQALPANSALALGAQNCHAATSGAHTGDVSAPMLRDVGCAYVIIGHSERRAAGETDADVAAKAKAAMAAELVPIICIGESRAAYDAGQALSVLDSQLSGLRDLIGQRPCLVAYEPIWAIGSSQTPQMAEISAAHQHIKSVLGSAIPVLYGGSVNAANAREILHLPAVAGGLIGGASLTVESMGAIIAAALKYKERSH